MKFFAKLLVFLGLATISTATFAQQKPVKILFLVDGSSSMLDDWQKGTQRFSAATKIVSAIMDSIYRVNPGVQFGVRVFGHQYPMSEKNCFDTKLEVPFSKQNIEQIKARLSFINPRGVSPIAWSLKQAAEKDFINSDDNAYSIILITDGGESCGGNLCETVTQLIQNRITFRPYILSLIDYAPLQKEYDCMGKFLIVSNPAQIQPAVQTIVEDNREMYEKNDGNLVVNKPVPVIVAPKVTEAPKVVEPPKVVEVPKPTEPVKEAAPVPKPTVILIKPKYTQKLQSLPMAALRRPKVNVLPRRTSLAKVVFPTIEEEAPRPKIALFKLPITRTIKPVPGLYVFEEVRKRPLRTSLPKIAFSNLDPVQPVTTAPPSVPKTTTPIVRNKPTEPVKTVQPKPVEPAPVEVKVEKSEETKVQIYFSNGKGKYYKTEPKIDFVSVKTNKTVQSNYRYVDKHSGEPDPIKLAAGTYVITRPGTRFRSKPFTLEANTTQKVNVIVGSGSFKFQYRDNPTRPVKEYYALISNRFEEKGVVKQRCDSLVEFEPARYHIEINTLPVTMAFTELNFMETRVISIAEPGTVQITSTSQRGRIQFWYQSGERFEPFYDMVLNGNPEQQKENFQPGKYQVRFFKDGDDQIKEFQIRSNETTKLEL